MPYVGEPFDATYFAGTRPEGYTDYLTINPAFWTAIADDIEFELELVAGKDVLEAGGAHGFLADILRQRGATIRVVDLSPYTISEGQARFPLLIFQQGDLRLGIGGPPNRFDLVVCLGVHDCLTDAEAKNLNTELNRLLRPQGSAYILFDTLNEHYPVKPNTWWASEGAAGFPGKNISVDDVGHRPFMYGGRMVAKA